MGIRFFIGSDIFSTNKATIFFFLLAISTSTRRINLYVLKIFKNIFRVRETANILEEHTLHKNKNT